jgi:hypothetical protein
MGRVGLQVDRHRGAGRANAPCNFWGACPLVDPAGEIDPESLGDAAQRNATLGGLIKGTRGSEGDQPPGRRGHEGVQGSIVWPRRANVDRLAPPISESADCRGGVRRVDCDLPPGFDLARLEAPARAQFEHQYPKFRTQLLQEHEIEATQDALPFTSLAATLSKSGKTVFDFAVVDEAQDVSVADVRFLAALGNGRPNALFFAGDLGQRIFQQPFSWKALGVDVRGRSRTLRVNYRTSHQIRTQADRLLGPVVTDVDGNSDDRSDTVSVFNGPPPTIQIHKNQDEEISAVGNWIAEHANAGLMPHEIGVFVRSAEQLERAQAAAKAAGAAFKTLDESVETTSGYVSIGTMHLAKGLEFRAVAVMACDDEIMPLQERIETVGEDADLREVYDTERHLLYVACTRARDHLLITSVEPASEFLDDLRMRAAPLGV